jgi:hypothetical protein
LIAAVEDESLRERLAEALVIACDRNLAAGCFEKKFRFVVDRVG